jgi:hypothetical protein
MNQNWKEFAKASRTSLEDDVDRKRKFDQLRGWVAEYLDDGQVDEFWEDLTLLTTEEINKFNRMASFYQEILRRIESAT